MAGAVHRLVCFGLTRAAIFSDRGPVPSPIVF
jgi:hypothetical protein